MRNELIEFLPKLRRFAHSICGNPNDGDDLLQTTVERLLKKGFPEGAHVAKWSYRVCRNIWIDELRSRKVRKHLSVEELGPDSALLADGEQHVIDVLTVDEVQRAVEKLNAEQRMALSLVAIEGLSYAEAAELLEVPIGTIMSRVARARSTLAKLYKR